MLAKLSIAICVIAAIATIALILPGEYLLITTPAEYVMIPAVIGPYLLVAIFIWRRRADPRTTRALFVLLAILLLVGCGILVESSSYRSELASHPRGPDYLKTRFQRMALFAVPGMQWLLAVLAGLALLGKGRSGPIAGNATATAETHSA